MLVACEFALAGVFLATTLRSATNAGVTRAQRDLIVVVVPYLLTVALVCKKWRLVELFS